MPRKLFISFLGTGVYNECVYYDDNKSYTPTKYIQRATLEQIGAEQWTGDDAIRIFVTDDAFSKNWDKSDATRTTPSGGKIHYVKLEQVLEDMKLKVQCIRIPNGFDSNEMWEIFQKVYDEIRDGDELYIDLTHAFRYMPMLLLVLSDYAKFLKHTEVAHLSYGNYEARKNVDGIDWAPIIDLLPLANLQDWTTAAADFLKYGQADGLKNIVSKQISIIKKNATSLEQRNKAGITKAFVDSIQAYTNERILCRGMDISSGMASDNLRKQINLIENSLGSNTGIPALNPVFDLIKNSLSTAGDTWNNCLNAAKWCYNRHLYQQAITILQEGIVSFFCERHSIPIDDRKRRELVNKALKITKDIIPEKEWKVEAEYKVKLKEILVDNFVCNPGIFKNFDIIEQLRNDYNHAGFRDAPRSQDSIIKQIGKSIEKFSGFFQQEQTGKDNINPRKLLFINLSNHPSSDWSSAQKEEAEKFGQIIDMTFPNVSSSMDSEAILQLAQDTVDNIKDTYPDADLTVHVMGEMTLTYNIVSLLKGCGIRCVASTTERDVQYMDDGSTVHRFRFAGFREY